MHIQCWVYVNVMQNNWGGCIECRALVAIHGKEDGRRRERNREKERERFDCCMVASSQSLNWNCSLDALHLHTLFENRSKIYWCYLRFEVSMHYEFLTENNDAISLNYSQSYYLHMCVASIDEQNASVEPMLKYHLE